LAVRFFVSIIRWALLIHHLDILNLLMHITRVLCRRLACGHTTVRPIHQLTLAQIPTPLPTSMAPQNLGYIRLMAHLLTLIHLDFAYTGVWVNDL
jgi:hypothetical protein